MSTSPPEFYCADKTVSGGKTGEAGFLRTIKSDSAKRTKMAARKMRLVLDISLVFIDLAEEINDTGEIT